MNFGRMETATGPGAECAYLTVFWPMKSCRQMLPCDRSENKKKSYFHCTVIIITSNVYEWELEFDEYEMAALENAVSQRGKRGQRGI